MKATFRIQWQVASHKARKVFVLNARRVRYVIVLYIWMCWLNIQSPFTQIYETLLSFARIHAKHTFCIFTLFGVLCCDYRYYLYGICMRILWPVNCKWFQNSNEKNEKMHTLNAYISIKIKYLDFVNAKWK